ncbi:MAG: hypothetical protein HYR63_26090 [Proteobacteria bacterium]|nr:hypothetical protein [Pseudomonadota bacterium]MBI3500057.1 hypothetical protein [Pseudomonadota bacterium]
MLLGPDDPAAVTTLRQEGAAPFLLLCDHASSAVPSALGDLGLPASAWNQHITYDIGAAHWADRFGDALGPILADPRLYRVNPDHTQTIKTSA